MLENKTKKNDISYILDISFDQKEYVPTITNYIYYFYNKYQQYTSCEITIFLSHSDLSYQLEISDTEN